MYNKRFYHALFLRRVAIFDLNRYKCISLFLLMFNSAEGDLTDAQSQLYKWIKKYLKEYQHSPSIRQMMQAMGLKSPAPIQSRLKHLQDKGYISWQEGKARTLNLLKESSEKIPLMGSVAAGGLIESFNDIEEELDIKSTLDRKGLFGLRVNGDSMIDANIADGDLVLMEPVESKYSLRNGDIVSAYVSGLGATLKYFQKSNTKIILEPANSAYEPLVLNFEDVSIQGRLVAVWRNA